VPVGRAAIKHRVGTELLSSTGNGMILPRCLAGIYFPLCFRNLSGMWYSITVAISLPLPAAFAANVIG